MKGEWMDKILERWAAQCASMPVLRFIDINLRGIGQVMFQDNPLTGLFFLVAIAWGAVAGGAPEILFAGILAVVTATLVAMWLRVDRSALNTGLYGFNAVLVGLALATFLSPGSLLWTYVVLGAAGSVVAMLATANALKPWGVAALTAPFVLVTWILLLATYGFSGLSGAGLPTSAIIAPFEAAPSLAMGLGDFFRGTLLSISQVFLKASPIAALLFLVGLAIGSPPAAAYAIAGAIVAVVTAHLFGAESDLIVGGLLGFSPVLTAVALGEVFNKPSPRVALYALLGTIFTAIAQSGFNVALRPFAIPALTAPFILVTWMFLFARPDLETSAPDEA
jgi:urea transporter